MLKNAKTWARAAAVALLLSASGASLYAGDDDLFTDGLIGQGVEKPKEPERYELDEYDRGSAPENLSLDSLDDRLREAGLSPRIDDGNRVVDITVAGVSVPVLVDVSGEKVTLVVQLASVPSGSSPNPTQLRQMLQANQVIAPAFFVFNATDNRLEMRRVMRNVGVTKEVLKAEFDHLANASGASTQLWTIADNPAQPPLDAQPPVQSRPAQPPADAGPPAGAPPAQARPAQPSQPSGSQPSGNGLAGRWVVELKQGGGFVIRFDQDGKFLLAHVKADGKIDRSEGKFQIANGQLVLKSDDGSTLQGQFAAIDTNRFTFAVGSGEGLTFNRR
jgi:hypothetical protein